MASSILLRTARQTGAAVRQASRASTLSASAARIGSSQVSRVGSSSRHASTQAAEKQVEDDYAQEETPVKRSSPAATKPSEPKAFQKSGDKVAVGSDFPEFSTLKDSVSPETLKAVTGKPLNNLTHMSAVQAAVLPRLPELAEPYNADAPSKAPRDLLVKAKTGTGKTLGFLIPAVEARIKAIDQHVKKALEEAGTDDRILAKRAERLFTRTEVGTLIISPTRELATQIANEAIKLTHHHEGFEVRLLVGGMSKGMQMRDWMKGRRDIVVATPGRLLDLLESEPEFKKGISKTRILVLDEADTLLDMGFRDDIEAITKQLPPTPERQTLLFSATVSRSVQQVARATLAENHEYINCVSEDDSPVHAHVTQYHTVVPNADQQIPHLLRLLAHDQLSQPAKSKVIVFLPTTRMVQLFSTLLRELAPNTLPSGRNTNVYEIHSKRTQDSRTNTSDRFRNDKSGASILVTSDVSARGVDYPGVTRVIQVGIPQSTEQYIHRIGRTGRGGTTGGRGDLVLLPWEIGFVTWQLTQVPLKPLTTEHLRGQVTELADKFDASPEAFFEGINLKQGGGFDRRGRRDTSTPQMFAAPYTPKLLEQENALKDLLAHADEEAVKETMASMLGYYISKTPELRVRKDVVVEGIKNWTVEACKLPVPPYVSPGFLQRLGLSDNRTKHFSRTYRDDYKSPASRQDKGWGNQGHNGRGRGSEGGERRVNYDLQEGDSQSDADEYRTPRFGRKQWSSNKGEAQQDFRSHRDEGDSLRGGRGRGRY